MAQNNCICRRDDKNYNIKKQSATVYFENVSAGLLEEDDQEKKRKH